MASLPVHPAPVITGLGLVTPLGRSTAQTWAALLAGRAIRDHSRVELSPGEPRVNALAVTAAREALAQAGWQPDASTAIVVCTSKGPVDEWLSTPGAALGNGTFGLAIVADAIAFATGNTAGVRLTVSAACASGLHGLIRAALLLRTGEARRVLVVAAEASVHPIFIASFNRLGVLPPVGGLCKPFDVHRQGFLMSEAAAAVCLEMPGDATAPPLAALDGYAFGGDATHLTGSDPAAKVLRHLLTRVVRHRPVDLVHAHGTGTAFNDPIELAALEASLPDRGTGATLYSHKGALGHSLGAAGLVAVVLNGMCHARGIVPGNVNTLDPLPSRLALSSVAVQRTVQTSIACASGFGGPTAVVRLRTPG